MKFLQTKNINSPLYPKQESCNKKSYIFVSIFLSILSGFAISLAFPPYNYHFLIWTALIPFLWVVIKAKSKKTIFLSASVFSIFYFGNTLKWILTINHWYPWGGTLALLGFILLGNFWILSWATISKFFLNKISLNKNKYFNAILLTTPCLLWAFIEWLRQFGTFGSTFAWLGYTQWQCSFINQISKAIGVYGISGIILLTNTSLTLLIMLILKKLYFITKKTFLIYLVISLVVIIFSITYSIKEDSFSHKEIPSDLIIIQPNIPQEYKLDKTKESLLKEDYLNIIEKAVQECNKNKTISQKDITILILPETILPKCIIKDKLFTTELSKLLNYRINSFLLLGSPSITKNKTYNSILVIDNNKSIIAEYNKEKLVPFGEYLPIPNIFKKIFRKNNYFHTEYNKGSKGTLLSINNNKLGMGICFESGFPKIYKNFSKNGADILGVITNDAWFLNSSAAEQHLILGVFRAIENNKWFIQCANTGISAIINPSGKVIKKIDANKKGFLIH